MRLNGWRSWMVHRFTGFGTPQMCISCIARSGGPSGQMSADRCNIFAGFALPGGLIHSEDLAEELLIEMKGMVLGYAEQQADCWTFHRPRRLPSTCPTFTGSMPTRQAPPNDAGAHGEPIGHRWALRRRSPGPVSKPYLECEFFPSALRPIPPPFLGAYVLLLGRTGAGQKQPDDGAAGGVPCIGPQPN